MAKSKQPKVNYKNLAKDEVMAVLKEALEARGYEFCDGADLDFTTKTVVVRKIGENLNDVAVTLTTPKAGEETYDYKVKAEDEEVAE